LATLFLAGLLPLAAAVSRFFKNFNPLKLARNARERRMFWRVLVGVDFRSIADGLGDPRMERRDQELLDKQLRHVQVTPRRDGVVMLMLTAVFFAGMAIGGFLYAYTGAPLRAVAAHAPPDQQVASNEVPIFVPQGKTTHQTTR
jgi:hypothetical protein